MNRRKRKIINKEYSFEDSPFYNEGVRLRSSLEELKAEGGTDIVLAKKRYYRQDDYVKIITTHDIDILKYYKSSDISKTILYYIIVNCLEYNNPAFRLVVDNLQTILGLETSKSIYKGLKELVALGYIARTDTREVYWINHNLFYKGVYVVDKYLKTKENEN